MLQDELVVLIHDLKVANASLVLSDLVRSIKTGADIRAEVIAWIQLLVAAILLASVVTGIDVHSYFGARLRMILADASTHAADVQSSVSFDGGPEGDSS